VVAGKSGTAQTGIEGAPPHAWFMAFAPAEAPEYAVAVIVEGEGGNTEQTGGEVAAPLAAAMLRGALGG
jgi:peptidoglycan glycosyltransferase